MSNEQLAGALSGGGQRGMFSWLELKQSSRRLRTLFTNTHDFLLACLVSRKWKHNRQSSSHY